MRPPSEWGLWMGLLSLCHLGVLPHSLGAEARSPVSLSGDALVQTSAAYGPLDATASTAADLRPQAGPPLQPAVSAPPEDPRVSACRYVGFQAEWLASKRDAGLTLGAAVAAAQRVWARDRPGYEAIAGALGHLVYREPQRSPTTLRHAVEADCLAQPRRWTERGTDG